MSKEIVLMLEKQDDLSHIKRIARGAFAYVYHLKQRTKEGSRDQIVRVITDTKNLWAIKKEKELLNYLNQFPGFIRFNEIRKVGYCYLQFFDFLGKKNLTHRVKKEGPLLKDQGKSLLKNMVEVLERVHKIGFVHADIKPSNIIVGEKRYFLIDWTGSIPPLSSFDAEMMVGDKKYSPPEIMNGILDYSGDVYSLGCTLYFALTGKHIFCLEKESVANQLWSKAHHLVCNLEELPTFFRGLISWMTQKEPHKRPSLSDLKVCLENETVPEWIISSLICVENVFPKNAMSLLADEGFLYPIFKKAVDFGKKGNLEQSFKLYEKCAFKGYSRGENNLGLMYEKGRFARQSYLRALNLYNLSFEKGNPYAAYNLGRFFEEGLGVEVNLKKAFNLYKFAALRGNRGAQKKVGKFYLTGKVVKKSKKTSEFWQGLATINSSVK